MSAVNSKFSISFSIEHYIYNAECRIDNVIAPGPQGPTIATRLNLALSHIVRLIRLWQTTAPANVAYAMVEINLSWLNENVILND